MTDIDAVLHELAEISERLHELPETAREERAGLRRRREELRAEARSTHEESPDEMREELRRLE
ncbi:hypothetical protein HQ535_00865, partial [bacterium]|nr:hypothetical protein [bacterium]